MKEFRLAAWPDLGVSYQRTAHRRMLSDMSHRYVSLAQLVATSGLSRNEVRQFLRMLEEHGLVTQRDGAEPASLFGSLRPLGGWLRRALTPAPDSR
jgi:predicted Rossmann fold nucleotide-binding protein DprA/Smf involved in DNA uptake